MSLLMIAHCTLQLSGLPLHTVLVTHDAENAAQIHTECSRCRPRSLIVFFFFFFFFFSEFLKAGLYGVSWRLQS